MSDAGPSRGPGTRRGKRRRSAVESPGVSMSPSASASTAAGPSRPRKRPRRAKERRERERAPTSAWARQVIDRAVESNAHAVHELDPGRFLPEELEACPQCRARAAQTQAVMQLRTGLQAHHGHKTRVDSLRRHSRDAVDGAVASISDTAQGKEGAQGPGSETPPRPSVLGPNRPPSIDPADEAGEGQGDEDASGEDDDGQRRSSRRDKGKGRAAPTPEVPASEIGTDERVSWELDDQEHEARVAESSSARVTRSKTGAKRRTDGAPAREGASDVDDAEVWMTPKTRAKLTWEKRRRDIRLAQALLPHVKDPAQPRPLRPPHPTISDAIHQYAAQFYTDLGAMRAPYKPKRTTPWQSEKRRELEEAGVWAEWPEEDPAEPSAKSRSAKARDNKSRGPYNARNMYGQFDGTAMLAFGVLFEELVAYQLQQAGYRPRAPDDQGARRKRRRKKRRAATEDAPKATEAPRRSVRFNETVDVDDINNSNSDEDADDDASDAEREIPTVVLEDSDEDVPAKGEEPALPNKMTRPSHSRPSTS